MKTTKDWLNFHLKESESFQNLILTQNLNDASKLGGALGRMVSRGKTERPSGVLLTGPSGSGKHHAAYHILQALDKEDCAPVFFTGASLAEGVSDFPGLAERINALLDRFYDIGQGLCIVLEEPDESGFSGQLYPFLGRIAHEYRNNPDELPALFLIFLAKETPALPSILTDLMLCCKCTLPDAEQRRTYIDDRAKSISNYVSLEHLAQVTEGCSYTAIFKIIKELEFLVDTSGCAPDSDTILRVVRQNAPTQEITNDDSLTSALERLETVFSDLADRISNLNLTGAVAAPVVNSVASVASQRQEREAPTLPSVFVDRKEYEEMPVRQLSAELFGEERANALLQN